MRCNLIIIFAAALVLACDNSDGGDESGDDAEGSGNSDPSGNDGPMTSGGTSLMCGLFNVDDVCTTCVIDMCCDQSQACADDEACYTCYQLMNAGDVLGAQQMGCFEHPPYIAFSDCVNEPSGCGPICSPPAGCGDYGCTYDSDCTTVGCSACTVDGVCQ